MLHAVRYLAIQGPGPPQQQPVDSVLFSALPVFDVLLSAGFQAREHEPREGQSFFLTFKLIQCSSLGKTGL